MKRGRIKADPSGPRFNDIGGETIDIPVSRHARLLGASALAGGVLRGLAIAAGMVTALGASPVFAQCASSATTLSGGRRAFRPPPPAPPASPVARPPPTPP